MGGLTRKPITLEEMKRKDAEIERLYGKPKPKERSEPKKNVLPLDVNVEELAFGKGKRQK